MALAAAKTGEIESAENLAAQESWRQAKMKARRNSAENEKKKKNEK